MNTSARHRTTLERSLMHSTNGGPARGRLARIGFGLATAATVTMIATGTAHADTLIPLPGGERTIGPYFLNSFGEQALISPALNANGTGRTAWVTGNITGSGPAEEDLELEVGYLVGCQVNLAGLRGELGANIDLDSPSIEAGLSIPLNAGEVKYKKITDIDLVDGKASVRYRDQGIEITGCGGYAQARQVVSLTTQSGANRFAGSLYGQPFSLG